jgi:6-phosphogluconolactonase
VTRLTALADAEAVAARAAAEIVRALGQARSERGVAHLALSGGGTPARTYELLAGAPHGLDGVELWFADERCVGPRDAQSNYLMVARTLLSRAGVASERVHRMEGELGPHEGAWRYRHALAEQVACTESGLPQLDLVVLGIGPDGHIASLFPGADTLDADESLACLGVEDSPKPPPQRITLSLAALRAARRCQLLATDASKADAIAAMLGEPTRHVPASLLRRERLTVIVDDACAPPSPPR